MSGSLGAIRASCCAYSSAGGITRVPAEADERQQGIAIVRMARQAIFENSHRLAATPGRMQRDGIDIGVSGLLRCQFGGASQFAKCLVEPLEPNQRQAERVVNPRILRNCSDGAAKDVLAIGFPLRAR